MRILVWSVVLTIVDCGWFCFGYFVLLYCLLVICVYGIIVFICDLVYGCVGLIACIILVLIIVLLISTCYCNFCFVVVFYLCYLLSALEVVLVLLIVEFWVGVLLNVSDFVIYALVVTAVGYCWWFDFGFLLFWVVWFVLF